MDKKQVVAVLEEIAALLELQGENPFKSRAYLTAARAIEAAEQELPELVETGALRNLKGIGDALAEKITELTRTGRMRYHEEQKAKFPPGFLELLRIPGLGPKKVKAVYERLGVSTLADLEAACRAGKVADLEGFGAKTQENILKGIEALRTHAGRFLLSDALPVALDLRAALASHAAARQVEVAGSLRRRRETVKDIDLIASATDPAALIRVFTTHPLVAEVLAHGPTKASIRLKTGIQADLRVVGEADFPFTLHHLTGSMEHNVAMRSRASARGLKLSEYGLFEGDTPLPCRNEAAIFERLGLAYIPPELREDLGEIEAAERGAIPVLLEDGDLQGTFHCHTTWSDGLNSLEEMAAAAQQMGYAYLGIADHSESARYAGGLTRQRVAEQRAVIDRLNATFRGFRLLQGIEADILADGGLDYDEETLGGFDYVVASVHSRFTMDAPSMTARLVKALNHPRATMLGHVSGRLLLQREPYAFDLEAVLQAAARHGVVVEINANPHRLDLDWRHLRRARELGVLLVINPDAHSTEGLRDIAYGVGVARKGWCTKADVLNTRPLAEVLAFLARRRAG
ncbi:MAG TPA: DNA polymerase/3'-5' exonuclease PolX [Candidatus Methylomirabilis sp.]|jgi:DNA polymerase (family 10)|nr:DNA polymerase/3'-5' exonuclease PolX [Candidatus Methylomirabilis sp.]